MDTSRTPDQASASDELKLAAKHLYGAADSTFERIVGKDLRSHMRSAVRHIFQAGVAAVDESERRLRERRRAFAQRAQGRPLEPTAASVPASDIAGGHVPECL